MKLNNKDKRNIRRALFNQVENILLAMDDKYSGIYAEFKDLNETEVTDYCYKIIGDF